MSILRRGFVPVESSSTVRQPPAFHRHHPRHQLGLDFQTASSIFRTYAADRVLTDMDKNPLHLWYAHPEDLTEAVTLACAPLLSEDERARWQAFRFDRHRREYLTTRALVRTALSHCHPLAPDAWRFQTNAYGKPTIDPDCGLRFNLSNSPGLVVCLIAQGVEVGVDAEPIERAEKVADLAPEVLSPLELAQLEGLPNPDRLDRALSLWTLKEAYVKARGVGLSLPLTKFSFLFGDAEGIRLELDPCLGSDAGQRWRFCVVEHAGHRIALMAGRATVPELQVWEARPLLAPPTRLVAGGELWYPASAVSSRALQQQSGREVH
jgi:4'-phosphopantetheinyl transferase